MANNCLVTKLKGVVDNDNLDIYGHLTFIFSAGSKITKVGYTVSDPNIVGKDAFLKGDAYFVNSNGTGNLGKSVTLAYGTNNLYISKNSGRLFLPGKYDSITSLTFNSQQFDGDYSRVSFDASSLNYNKQNYDSLLFGREEIAMAVAGMSISNIANVNFKCKVISFNKAVCDAADLSSFVDNISEDATVINFRNTDIAASTVSFGKCTKVLPFRGSKKTYGDFSELGKMISCNRLEPDNGCTLITGTVEGFVAAAIAARQAAGESGAGQISTTYFDLKFPNVTYNGGSIVSGEALLSWDAQGNITWQ